MSQKFLWCRHLPNETLEGGIELANQLYWHLVVSESDGMWYVWAGGGESLIFKTDSQEAVDAFLYGVGLAYAVLPSPVFEQLKADIKQWVE